MKACQPKRGRNRSEDSVQKNAPTVTVLQHHHAITDDVQYPPYPGVLQTSMLLNESHAHYPDIQIIEQCLIKTNETISRILVYGPDNK